MTVEPGAAGVVSFPLRIGDVVKALGRGLAGISAMFGDSLENVTTFDVTVCA